MNNSLIKRSRLYIEQKNYLSGPHGISYHISISKHRVFPDQAAV